MARICPVCGKTYSDEVSFCLDDGQALTAQALATAHTMMGGAGTAENPAAQVVVPASYSPAQSGVLATMPPTPTAARTAQAGPATAQDPLGFAGVTASNAQPAFVEPTMVELVAGTPVGEYVIEKQIGEGGMGVIFAARHPIIGKRVAIKVLNPDMAANASVVQRFIQEARSVNQIGNRNIVDIFSFGRLPDGRHYFVMEFLDGMPFSKRILMPMQWTDAMSIWLQMCSAVDAAHQRGIVHRDLKPDNIFVLDAGEGPFVKVLDFGIAKLMNAEGTGVQKTSTGVPMGTPLYMSPEQTRGGAVDHRTDIYATGIILYETVTGETPFNAPSFFEVMSKQLTEPPPAFKPEISLDGQLEQLIFQCLEKEPEARPQTMAEVRDRLIALRDECFRNGRALFERPWDPRAESPPSDLTHKDGATDKQGRSPRRGPVDAGYTVPDPRESQVMAVQQVAAGAQPAPRSSTSLIVGVTVGLAAVGAAVAVVALKKSPPPPAPVIVQQPAPAPAAPPKDGSLILVTQSGVTVFLDDEKKAEGGPTIQLKAPPGHHQLKVTRPGFLPFSKDVVFVAGDTVGETATLEPEKPPPVQHTGGGKKRDPATKPDPKHDPVPVTHDGTVNPFGN